MSLAVELEKKPKILGPTGLYWWTRKQKKNSKNKESQRWWQQIENTNLVLKNKESIIHVTDREGDDYGLFHKLVKNQVRHVIRLAHNRCITEEDKKLFEVMRKEKAISSRNIALSFRKEHFRPKTRKIHPARDARETTLLISAKQVELKRNDRHLLSKGYSDFVSVNIVRVYEPKPPKGEKPVEWFLCTSEPIDTCEQIERIVDIYKTRWVIEEFFKALKSGCNLEAKQLESADAWFKILALYTPISCFIYNLKTLDEGEKSISGVTKVQRNLLSYLAKKEGRKVETLGDIKREIAQLGGHIKYSGPPGWIVLTRGYLKLLYLETGWIMRDAICD